MSKILDYLQKEASFAHLADELTENAVGILPYLIGIPAAGGAATGYLASKMTSPTDSDREALQERVMDTKVREELGTQQRKLEALKQKLKERRAAPSISRRRDMFA